MDRTALMNPSRLLAIEGVIIIQGNSVKWIILQKRRKDLPGPGAAGCKDDGWPMLLSSVFFVLLFVSGPFSGFYSQRMPCVFLDNEDIQDRYCRSNGNVRWWQGCSLFFGQGKKMSNIWKRRCLMLMVICVLALEFLKVL